MQKPSTAPNPLRPGTLIRPITLAIALHLPCHRQTEPFPLGASPAHPTGRAPPPDRLGMDPSLARGVVHLVLGARAERRLEQESPGDAICMSCMVCADSVGLTSARG